MRACARTEGPARPGTLGRTPQTVTRRVDGGPSVSRLAEKWPSIVDGMAADLMVRKVQSLEYESAHVCSPRDVEMTSTLPAGFNQSCQAKLRQVLADARD